MLVKPYFMTNKKGENRTKKEEERRKKLIMWVGISLIMFLISIGWIFNIKGVLNQSKNISSDSNQSEWSEIKDELSQAINKAKGDINQLKNNPAVQELKDELQVVDQKNQEEVLTKPLPLAEDRVDIFSENKILDLPAGRQD